MVNPLETLINRISAQERMKKYHSSLNGVCTNPSSQTGLHKGTLSEICNSLSECWICNMHVEGHQFCQLRSAIPSAILLCRNLTGISELGGSQAKFHEFQSRDKPIKHESHLSFYI